MTRPFSRSVTQRQAEQVGEALRLLPPAVRSLIGDTAVWEGDVLFGGLWRPAGGQEYYPRARCHWWRRGPSRSVRSAITLPSDLGAMYWGIEVGTVLHEYGHALFNRLVLGQERERVYWSVGDGEVVVKRKSGILPSIRPLVAWQHWQEPYHLYNEQFAEAFRIWLSPPQHLQAQWEPEQFYVRPGSIDDWGVRADNRRLLAWFNALEGWAWDRPPRALLPFPS